MLPQNIVLLMNGLEGYNCDEIQTIFFGFYNYKSTDIDSKEILNLQIIAQEIFTSTEEEKFEFE